MKMSNYLASHSDTEKKTVMICDDERDLLELFGKALKSKYNVILVSSGEDCIDKYIDEKNQGNKIHLILLDYRLGVCLAILLLGRLKSITEQK